MAHGMHNSDSGDPYQLQRFIAAQETSYDDALAELQAGQKRTHWMWYIFPQIDGLGFSSTARHYAIKSEAEARQYLAHPVLGQRLRTCAAAVLAVEGRSAAEVFGFPDLLKLQSSMTLFGHIDRDTPSVFQQVLDKYYGGARDERTMEILAQLRSEDQ